MQEIRQIKAAIESFKESRKKLLRRWDDDLDLYRGKPYDAGKGYYSYTTNTPHVVADKVIGLIADSELVIRIPLEDLNPSQEQIAGNIERFLYGCFNLNDDCLILLGEPAIRQQMTWYSVLRGGFAMRVFVRKAENGETMPEVVVWDARETAYQLGQSGLLWATHSYKMSKEAIEDAYGIWVGTDEGEVIDFWDGENNAIIVNDQWAKKPEPHELDYCPVFLFRVGTMPAIQSARYADTYVLRGESVYAAIRDLIPIVNKSMSDMLTLIRRGVKTPLVFKSRGGQKPLDEDVFQVEKASAISIDIDESITPLLPPMTPPDTQAQLAIVTAEIQRGTVPHTTFGQLGFMLSGYAINQLIQAIRSTILPYNAVVEQAYRIACKELLKQFKAGFKAIKISGRTSTGKPFGYPEPVKVSPQDLKSDWLPEVRLEAKVAQDEAQKFYLAEIARRGEIPLLSDQTIRDEIIGVKDPELEGAKVLEQIGGRLPSIQLKHIYDALIRRGQFEDAMVLLSEVRKLAGQGTPEEKGAVPAEKPTTTEMMSAQTPGAGMPAEEVGMPSTVLPPETLGGVPGGATRAGMPGEGLV